MGLRGFQKQSEETARMKGTFRKDRYVKKDKKIDGLEYLESIPKPSESLNEDGKRYWNNTLNHLIKNGFLIAKIDLFAFEQLCYKYQLLIEFTKEMNEKGQTYVNKAGKVRISPYVKMYSETLKAYLSMSRMFGLTPSSRENLHSKPEESEEDLFMLFHL